MIIEIKRDDMIVSLAIYSKQSAKVTPVFFVHTRVTSNIRLACQHACLINDGDVR